MVRAVGMGVITEPLTVPNDQPLDFDFNFWTGRGRSTPATVSAATAYLRHRGATTNALNLTTGGGVLSISGQTVSLRILEAAMRALGVGVFDFVAKVTVNNGSVRQVRATFNVIAGLS